MPRKLDFTSLEIFVAVCESRSITHAAELENMSASAISKRISQLEQFAGTQLLIRTNSGVAPTNEGLQLLEHARSLLYNFELLERDVGNSAANLRGCVRILANRSANASFVAESVASFLANPRNQSVDVQIAESTSHEVVSGVKNGFATLGVCWAETDMAGVEWTPGRRDQLSAVVPKNHVLAKREHVAFAETLDYEHVGMHSGGPVTHLLRRESVRVGKSLKYRILAPTFDGMVSFVTCGLGVAIMPATVALRYARSSRIAVISLTDAWKDHQFAVSCRSRRALSRTAADLFKKLVLDFDDVRPAFERCD